MRAGSQAQVTYNYDLDTNLTSVSRSDTGTVQLQYDSDNHRTSVSYANGVNEAYGFDADSRVTTIVYSKGLNQLGNLGYDYDADGRRIEITGSLASTVSAYVPPGNQAGSYTYGKDGSINGTGANSAGDMTLGASGLVFTYNSRNQLAENQNLNSGQTIKRNVCIRSVWEKSDRELYWQ